MSTSICDFSASGPSFHADVLTGASSGPSEAGAGDSAPGSSSFSQTFAEKLADLAAQRSPSGDADACGASDAAVRQEVAAVAPDGAGDDPAGENTSVALDMEEGAEGAISGMDPSTWAAQAAVAAVAGLQSAGSALTAPGAAQALSSSWGLTTVAVSPGLNVIQPAQSELDGQSLMAFARAQGLDDRAVQWLFGQEVNAQELAVSSAPTAASALAASSTTSALTTLPALTANPQILMSGAGALDAGSPAQAGTAVAAQLQAQVEAQAEGATRGSLSGSLSGPPSGSFSASADAMVLAKAAFEAASEAASKAASDAAPGAKATDVNASMASRDSLAAAAVANNSANGFNSLQGAGAGPGGMPAQVQQAAAALNWLRDTTSGGSAALWGGGSTRTLVSGNGVSPSPTDPLAAVFNVSKSLLQQTQKLGASSTASARTGAAAARVTHGTLDLSSSLDPELIEWLEVKAAGGVASGAAGRLRNSIAGASSFEGGAARVLAQWAKSDPSASATETPTPTLTAGASSSTSLAAANTAFRATAAGLEGQLAHAQERAQRLADRLGEAVGQRMLTELEKGNWHLNLKLRPESLGSIDIEMRMNAGQLNAQFTAHQAATRDLISDGLNRLKDTLAQMGMNVAQMNVNGGRSQQRGGDSTPRSSQGVRAPEATSNNQEADAKNPSLRPSLRSGNGWDMLV